MSDHEMPERRAEFQDRFEALVGEFQDFFAPELETPIVSDWVVVVTHDSIGDGHKGTCRSTNARNQWWHRTVGLLTAAIDDYRIVKTDAEG